jgi:thiosulfate/3-mercaptopyruvate sulfurtransferase
MANTLITPEELLGRQDDPRLRIADVRWYLGEPERGQREYTLGHLPGAVFVDLDADLAEHRPDAGRHPLPDPGRLRDRLAGLGIGSDHAVVAYDDQKGAVAARLWWMLDRLGHPNVSVLDGGLQAWLAAGGRLTSEVPSFPPASLELRDAWTGTIDRPALTERSGGLLLLDVRAPERYRGEIEPVDPVAGHIPGAVNAPIGGNTGSDGRFHEAARLAERYRELGVHPSTPVVVSCGSGVNACQAALALRISGLPDPLLYPGSYSDWSTAGMPIAVGTEPGSPA